MQYVKLDVDANDEAQAGCAKQFGEPLPHTHTAVVLIALACRMRVVLGCPPHHHHVVIRMEWRSLTLGERGGSRFGV